MLWQFPLENPFGEFFGLGPRDEGASIGFELVLMKPDRAQKVLERDPFAPFFEGITERGEVGFVHRAVELQVEIHPSAAELAGDEHLHVAACIIDSAFFEVAGPAINGFQNGAHLKVWGQIALAGSLSQDL